MSGQTRRLAFGALLVLLVVFPFVVPRPDFWVVSVGIRSLWLGIVTMSLTFMAKYLGLLSLGQMTFWGVAGYTVAIMSTQNEFSYLISLPAAVGLATAVAFVVGLITMRTQGVYFLMLTLAVSQLAFFLVLNAATLTRGHVGIGGIERPEFLGFSLANRNALYFTCLALAVGTYLLCRYVSRTPFGLALEGIRDSPDRMEALGYNIYRYKVAAFTFAGFVASISGALALFYHGRITPGAVDLIRSIDILIVAVLGGIGSLAGAFAGAVGLTTLQNFAQTGAIDMRRLTLTGLVFLLVLLFFPGGVTGLPDQVRRGWAKARARGWVGGRGRDETADGEGKETPQPVAAAPTDGAGRQKHTADPEA